MYLLYFLETYINWLNIYKEFHWMYPLTGAICIKMQEKHLFGNIKFEIILEVFTSNHLQAYEKEYWRRSGCERIIRGDHQNYLFDKREMSYDKPSACQKRRKTFL